MRSRSLLLLCSASCVLAAGAHAQSKSDDKLLGDPAFEASLPPLTATAPDDKAVPTTDPAPSSATPAEPANDPELTAALPPLTTFDASPPRATDVAQEGKRRRSSTSW